MRYLMLASFLTVTALVTVAGQAQEKKKEQGPVKVIELTSLPFCSTVMLPSLVEYVADRLQPAPPIDKTAAQIPTVMFLRYPPYARLRLASAKVLRTLADEDRAGALRARALWWPSAG